MDMGKGGVGVRLLRGGWVERWKGGVRSSRERKGNSMKCVVAEFIK